jgi:hypothetical protein
LFLKIEIIRACLKAQNGFCHSLGITIHHQYFLSVIIT